MFHSHSSTTRAPSPAPSSVASTPRHRHSKSVDAMKPPRKEEDPHKETKIQVVVRCRGPDPNKQHDGDTIVETKSTQVVIRSNSTSKTYNFDRVFDFKASQELIYEEVVQSILEQVLEGYNCTVFAYGQTGTGKTYTMEGALAAAIPTTTPSAHTSLDPQAGVIPRTLHRLFEILDSEKAEYSVRVSSIELYNEELRDLLSVVSLHEPKIFDDPRGKGVIIKPLEEVVVKTADEGIKALRAGSTRRVVARTNSNDNSSRSHYVFTLTVHIKETTPEGEELLKVGKLNMVDLAGSENIGRSGAENERAREAKNINQSLLTLGRVINALVAKRTNHSGHVPYRESKLTRLLQDSLGGRTKTCIIATISPDKDNLEETLSTLDYAARAKNILNTPEVNQRMTKKALMKEYVAEIKRLQDDVKRLQDDLKATRDKNGGIYLTNESYNILTNENQSRKDQVEELQRNLVTTKEELEAKSIELRESSENLEYTRKKLDNSWQGWREETILRKAHEYTEQKLDRLASEVAATLEESSQDVNELYGRLDRKTAMEHENRRAIGEFQRGLLVRAGELETQMVEFSEVMGGVTGRIRDKMIEFREVKAKELTEAHVFVDDRLRQLRDDQAAAEAAADEGDAARRGFRDAITAIRVELRAEMERRHEVSRRVTEALFDGLKKNMEEQQEQIESVQKQLGTKVQDMIATMQAHVETQNEAMRSLRDITSTAVDAETLRLQTQNTLLETLIEQERTKSTHMANELVSDISKLIANFTTNKERSLSEAVGQARVSVDASTDAMQQFIQQFGAKSQVVVGANLEQLQALAKTKEVVSDEIERASQMVHRHVEETGTMGDGTKKRIFEEMDSQEEVMVLSECRIGEAMTAAIERQNDAAAKFVGAHDSLAGNARQGLDHLAPLMERVKLDLEKNEQEVTGLIMEVRGSTESFDNTARQNIERTKAEINCYELETDEPTGTTPQKRDYRLPKRWNLTRDHDDLLREFRESGHIKQTFTSEEDEVVITGETLLPTFLPALSPSPAMISTSGGSDDSGYVARSSLATEPMSNLYDESASVNGMDPSRFQPPSQPQAQLAQPQASRLRSRKNLKRPANNNNSTSSTTTPASVPLSPSQSENAATTDIKGGINMRLPRPNKRARGNEDENRAPA